MLIKHETYEVLSAKTAMDITPKFKQIKSWEEKQETTGFLITMSSGSDIWNVQQAWIRSDKKSHDFKKLAEYSEYTNEVEYWCCNCDEQLEFFEPDWDYLSNCQKFTHYFCDKCWETVGKELYGEDLEVLK